MMRFGELIRSERLRKGIMQVTLSRQSGVSVPTLVRLESGRQRTTTFEKGLALCMVLGIPWELIRQVDLEDDE
jgi:transcriptional regulator with XRE-family HTH domain